MSDKQYGSCVRCGKSFPTVVESDLHHCVIDSSAETVIDVDGPEGRVVVTKLNNLYTVCSDGTIRHPNGDADMAIRAMAQYLHGTTYSYNRLLRKTSTKKD